MAGQKPAGRGRAGGNTQGGGGRQGGGTRQGASSRQSTTSGQNQGRPRPGGASSTIKANGASSRSGRSSAAAETAATKARSASATSGAKQDSDSQAASPATGLLGKIVGPFRTVGFVPLATWVLSLYALGASIYLTIAHYDANVTLVCSDKGLVNCAEVTTSPQSMVFGVLPVAVLGLAYYVFMTALNSPWVWRLQQTGSEQLSKILRYTRLGAVVTGMGFVLYLIYAELIQIKAICLWCTSVHVATFLIFALIVFYTTLATGPSGPGSRGQAGPLRRA